jgi:cytochrome c oxidase subunit 2
VDPRRAAEAGRGQGGGTMTSLSSTLFAQAGRDLWLAPPASEQGHVVDNLFTALVLISVFFFALIVGLMTLFVLRYRRRAGVGPGKSPSHNTTLELVWSGIPVLIVAAVFYFGFTGYMELRTPPRDAYEIEVVARKWNWNFRYPNGHDDENLHVPVDAPVRLKMRSEDVLHGFAIPAMRVHMNVAPDRYTNLWFHPNRPGTFGIVCTQYCGTQHFSMLADAIVHRPGEFEVWLKDAAAAAKNKPPLERGRDLFRKHGCGQCHSIDGVAGTGPTLYGIFGGDVDLEGGESAVADENYVRESILEPQAKIVKGFTATKMNPYRLTEEEISDLIEYIKTLK